MKIYNAIGVMSGTSLDGLDLALCQFWQQEKWQYKILKAATLPYNKQWKEKLSSAQNISAQKFIELDIEYGKYIGKSILQFIENEKIQIDLIASHGHTIFHTPQKGTTCQIGNGNQICATTGINTVSDFRSLDVALGGQGAPLVPIGDKLLFSEFDYCINVGGFANISFEKNNTRYAYDICPANIILNKLAKQLGHEYDKDGKFAEKGNVNQELLNKLNKLEYYQKSFPKSLGREWLEERFIPILNNTESNFYDKIKTLYEHISTQITESVTSSVNKKVLITGGGAYNKFLIHKTKTKTQTHIVIPEKNIIEFKEALIFALLGVLRINQQINCLCSVTGARQDSSSGTVCIA